MYVGFLHVHSGSKHTISLSLLSAIQKGSLLSSSDSMVNLYEVLQSLNGPTKNVFHYPSKTMQRVSST